MAEPHSLKAGDRVRHPQWPEGTVRTLTGTFRLGTRGQYTKSGYKVSKVPDERYMDVGEAVALPGEDPMEADSYWAEAGLEKVDG